MIAKATKILFLGIAIIWGGFLFIGLLAAKIGERYINSDKEISFLMRMFISCGEWLKINVFVLTGAAVILWCFYFWGTMLVDCFNATFKNDKEKVIWIFIIFLLNFIGALGYYFIVKKSLKPA